MVIFMLWLLYIPVKEAQYPLIRRLGGPKSWSGYFGEDKNFVTSASNLTLDRPACSLVSMLTTVVVLM
jgi:hypothetical protein